MCLKGFAWYMCSVLYDFYTETFRFLVSYSVIYFPGYLLIATQRLKQMHVTPIQDLEWVANSMLKGIISIVVATILLGASIEYCIIRFRSSFD